MFQIGKPKKTSSRSGDAAYERVKERSRRIQAELSKSGRDIGRIPDIADLDRRKRCHNSLRLFCQTYNPKAFHLAWSEDHLSAIERLEEAATHGALYAFAMPRGSGKTLLCRMAALWAVSYAICRYVYVIGANADKAEDSLAALKMFIRFLPDYAADFPEVSRPVQSLEGISLRARGQLCQGRPTMTEWSKSRIILPTVPPPENWPKEWPLRNDGAVPTSGTVISASGLTGDGIRGSLLTLPTGESLRPDLVLLDDPQTHESATSATQNATREQLISADVLGMAGPGKSISAVMPCTVIAHGDMVDRLLDRSKHPLWRGQRTALLKSMPANMPDWDRYFEVYAACVLKEPPDFTEANAYYQAHQERLDAGAEAGWTARHLPAEISAIQHAMHLYYRDPRAFFAEYQNQPQSDQVVRDHLTGDEIASKLISLARGRVPQFATRVTAFVDVQKDVLFWVVCAWADNFTGHVLDYGTYPDQKRGHFSLRNISPTLEDATGVPGVEAQIYAGLKILCAKLLSASWVREDGAVLNAEKILVDANWQTEAVKSYCRSANNAAIVPAHGRYFGPTAAPMSDWNRKQGDRYGLNWIVSKHVLYDTNFWKSFVFSRLATPPPSRGCLTLYGDRPGLHRLFVEHLTSEIPEKVEARNRTREIWSLIPGRENHWLDCLVGCAVAASVQGCVIAETAEPAPPPKIKVRWSEMQRRKKEAREAAKNELQR